MRVGELFHRLAAGAGGVEDEAIVVVFERGADGLDAGRGNAEHGEAERRLGVDRFGGRMGDHAAERVRRVGEHLAADAVEALHVGDGVHHAQVTGADVGAGVARGDGADEDLGRADRQGAHRRRHQRRAARAAGREQAGDVIPAADEMLEGHGHRRHGAAAVAGENGTGTLWVARRHGVRADVRRRGMAAGGQVDGAYPDGHAGQAIAQVVEFFRLGVEGAGDVGVAVLSRCRCCCVHCASRGFHVIDCASVLAWGRFRGVAKRRAECGLRRLRINYGAMPQE